MTRYINSMVRFIYIGSFLFTIACNSPEKKEQLSGDPIQQNYTEYMASKVDSVRLGMSEFFTVVESGDSIGNVAKIRRMHYGTGNFFMGMDTTSVPSGDSLVWTTATSLKNFYLESQHILANEVLFVMDSLPLSDPQKDQWTNKINNYVQKEKQYYTLFKQHTNPILDTFVSVYQPLYHSLGLTE